MTGVKRPKKEQSNNLAPPGLPPEIDPQEGAKKGIRQEQVKKMHLAVAGICVRNGVDTGGVYPFVLKVVKEFGLVATEEAIRMAKDLCNSGGPQGMIYDKAKKLFAEMGNMDDAYLDAMLTERHLRGLGPPADRDVKRFALEEVVKPFTNRRISALTRLGFYDIVREYCQDHPHVYDYRLIQDYFDELVAADSDRHRRILVPEDVPVVDLSKLKGSA
jgi:hypothetical protein